MRYWIGAACFAAAAALTMAAWLHRRRVLAIAPREAIERQRAAALADPRSIASMGEIGRSLVTWFVGYAALKTGFLWFAFHADRYLSLFDLAGFYAALAAYVASITLQTRWRLSDALAAAEVGAAAITPATTVADANAAVAEAGIAAATRAPSGCADAARGAAIAA